MKYFSYSSFVIFTLNSTFLFYMFISFCFFSNIFYFDLEEFSIPFWFWIGLLDFFSYIFQVWDFDASFLFRSIFLVFDIDRLETLLFNFFDYSNSISFLPLSSFINFKGNSFDYTWDEFYLVFFWSSASFTNFSNLNLNYSK